MKIEMSHIPHEKDDRNTNDFIKIRAILEKIFEQHTNTLLMYHALPDKHNYFLHTCMLLEDACMIYRENKPKYTLRYKVDGHLIIDTGYEADFRIRIQKGPSANWIPFDDRVQQLTGMEVVMTQNSHHFIRIGLEGNILNIYTNQTLSWNNLYKLKRMQYQIFKEYYTDCDPALFDFFDALIADDLIQAQNALDHILNNPELERMQFDFLKDYFTSDKERLITIYEERIKSYQKQVDSLQNQLTHTISRLNDDLLQCHGLRTTEDDFDVETIIHYLTYHPYIIDISKGDTKDTLRLHYKAPLLYYDDSLLDPLIQNAGTRKRKAILKILKERKYVIWTECFINYRVQDFQINAQPNTATYESNTIPHPHIDHYGCLGNHTDAINDWKETGDYIGCIDQITAAVLNLNVVDGAVMNALLQDLIEHPLYKCFQNNETKEFVAFNDILEEKENNGETQTE